jgi:hypothetical protein
MTGVAEFVLDQVRVGYRRTHDAIIDVARRTEEASFDKPFGTANSIAFNLWHVARWDDSLFESMAVAVPAVAKPLGHPLQIWTREKLGERWGLPADLGAGAAGTGLRQDTAQGLALPGRDALLDYATHVFGGFADHLTRVTSADLELLIPPKNERSIGHWVLYYWEHAARHLGMMEALRGVFGEAGSARG